MADHLCILIQESIEKLTDDELRAKTDEFRKRIKSGKEDVNGPLLEEAFAVSERRTC